MPSKWALGRLGRVWKVRSQAGTVAWISVHATILSSHASIRPSRIISASHGKDAEAWILIDELRIRRLGYRASESWCIEFSPWSRMACDSMESEMVATPIY
ncbi:Uncharacterized protein HZ326_25334 [Fusarium oxysporum f. sp. albedinis]|nr:Uncharacterized protein HZ326_25334 [Fusarium oxysporum f. sp. albedinis]